MVKKRYHPHEIRKAYNKRTAVDRIIGCLAGKVQGGGYFNALAFPHGALKWTASQNPHHEPSLTHDPICYNICKTNLIDELILEMIGRIVMVKLTIRKVGNSLGLTLPAEAAKALRVKEGDALYLTETPEGYQLVAYDPDFEKTMKAAEGFMKRYRNALRELAK